jgi:hypothetical protein
MKPWRLAIPLLTLAASGCTVGQHHAEVTALQNENRDLEDNVYRQQAALQDLCQQLDACRKDNETLRRRLQDLSPSGSEISPKPPAAPAPQAVKPPSVEFGQPVPSGQLPPLLRSPSPSTSPGAGGIPKAPEETEAPPFQPPSTAPPATRPQPDGALAPPSGALRTVNPSPPLGLAVQGDNTKVAAISLRPVAAAGNHAEQSPGGDGIALWIEPRDQAGNLVRAAAPVAVVVLDPDPSMAGPSARVARWDFASEATAAFYRKTATAEGIFLELTWPGDPPKHRTLEVFVRYTRDDGRKIEARQVMHLDLAGQSHVEPPAGWSPRAAPAPAPAAAGTTPHPSQSAEKPNLDLPAWSPDRP